MASLRSAACVDSTQAMPASTTRVRWSIRRRGTATLVALGVWRSLVARSVRVGEVPSSNLGTPIGRGGNDVSPTSLLLFARARHTAACSQFDVRSLLAMDAPIRYARSGDVNIAYQVTGGGPFDLVLVPGFFSHLEIDREHSGYADFLERLGSFARLICFDKRGTGLSDRGVGLPDLETRMDDVRAVMDAAGSDSAALLGYSEGGPMCVLFAATYPERTRSLVLYGTYAKRRDPDERLPVGADLGGAGPIAAELEETWGENVDCGRWRRTRTPRWQAWFQRRGRAGAQPGRCPRPHPDELGRRRARAARRASGARRSWSIARAISTCESRKGATSPEHIRHARFVELAGDDHFRRGRCRPDPRRGRGVPHRDAAGPPLRSHADHHPLHRSRRLHRTGAGVSGDARWTALLDEHHEVVRRELDRFDGEEIDTAGDGFLASFDGPARSIRCALEIRRALRALELDVRAGDPHRRGRAACR